MQDGSIVRKRLRCESEDEVTGNVAKKMIGER